LRAVACLSVRSPQLQDFKVNFMRRSIIAVLLSTAALASPALAQQPPAAGAVVASAPGMAVAAGKVQASAVVTAIDLATRTVTLKGAQGRVFDVVAGDEVRNLEQVRVGDTVVVEYVRALALELVKGTGVREGGAPSERGEAVRAQPGEKPAGAVGRQITAIADVIDVNPKAKTITLKGPKGNVVELAVENPDQFKVVKKGDKVRVDYVEAVAVSVQAAPAKPAAKK
jgi:hypothetical protein